MSLSRFPACSVPGSPLPASTMGPRAPTAPAARRAASAACGAASGGRSWALQAARFARSAQQSAASVRTSGVTSFLVRSARASSCRPISSARTRTTSSCRAFAEPGASRQAASRRVAARAPVETGSGISGAFIVVLCGSGRLDPAVTGHDEHEDTVGDEPERDGAEKVRAEGLAGQGRERAAKAPGLVRVGLEGGLDQEDPYHAEDYAPCGVAETSGVRRPPLLPEAHLARLELLLEVGFVCLVELVEARADDAHAGDNDEPAPEGLGHQGRRPVVRRTATTAPRAKRQLPGGKGESPVKQSV